MTLEQHRQKLDAAIRTLEDEIAKIPWLVRTGIRAWLRLCAFLDQQQLTSAQRREVETMIAKNRPPSSEAWKTAAEALIECINYTRWHAKYPGYNKEKEHALDLVDRARELDN